MRVVWVSVAEQDLGEAYRYIASGSPEAAERFFEAVHASVEVLRRAPELGRARQFRASEAAGVRSWAVAGFPSYLVLYRVSDDRLEIVRLLHGARDLPSLVREEAPGLEGAAH